ncbi:hypothetical protein D3C80_1678160 [compost metagenome]
MLHRRIFYLECIRNLSVRRIRNVIAVYHTVINILKGDQNLRRVQHFNINIELIRFHTVNVEIRYARSFFNFDPAQFFQNTKCTLLVYRIIRNSYSRTVFNIV